MSLSKVDQNSEASFFPGLLSIIASTVLTVMLTPVDVQELGSLILPATCLTIGLLAPILIRASGDVRSILRGEHILMIAIVYWLLFDLLKSAYPLVGLNSADVDTTFVAIGVFSGGVWVGAAGSGWRLPNSVCRAAQKSPGSNALVGAVLVSFGLGMFDFAYHSGFNPTIMIEGVFADRWAAPWSRAPLGGINAFFNHMQYFGYILPALCVLLAQREGWLKPRVLVSVVLAAIMMLFLAQSGGRRIVGVSLGSGLVTWVLCQRFVRARMVVVVSAATLMLLSLLQEMLKYRGVGLLGLTEGKSSPIEYSSFHVDDNFLRLGQIVTFFPEQYPYVYFQPIYHALTLPIPRVLWPEKPIDPGFDLPAMVGLKGLSLSCSIVGELYASFGLTAVLLGGLFIGRLAGMWNKLLTLRGGLSGTLVFGLGLMVLFAGVRSMQALVQMSYIVLAWIAISQPMSEIEQELGRLDAKIVTGNKNLRA